MRTVVDGQQRIRAILGFLNGDFKISSAHNKKFKGLAFDDLPDDVQDSFRNYEKGATIALVIADCVSINLFNLIDIG